MISIRKALFQLVGQFADDILTLAGIGVVVYAAFQLHPIAGMFSLGAALILAGVALARAAGR